MYQDANNLYRQAISQKLPADGLKWINGFLRFYMIQKKKNED